MNRIIAGLAIAGAIVSAAPNAHADDGTTKYIVDLAAAGVPQDTAAGELAAGRAVCDAAATGASLSDIAAYVIAKTGFPPLMVTTIVALSVADLCPQYAPQGTRRTITQTPVTIASSLA
jgi:hypothetical protein